MLRSLFWVSSLASLLALIAMRPASFADPVAPYRTLTDAEAAQLCGADFHDNCKCGTISPGCVNDPDIDDGGCEAPDPNDEEDTTCEPYEELLGPDGTTSELWADCAGPSTHDCNQSNSSEDCRIVYICVYTNINGVRNCGPDLDQHGNKKTVEDGVYDAHVCYSWNPDDP